MDVRTFLKEHTLIFDGAMGSYLMAKYDTGWGQDTTPPFLMENDVLMDDAAR